MKSGNTCAETGGNIGGNNSGKTGVKTRGKTAVVITVLAGAFAVMAMSNAVVPVLNLLAKDSPQIQGIIYSAYFLGAFLTVLPAGMISDRVGRTLPIHAGLILTVIAGIAMILLTNPYMIAAARFAEGIGAGLFVASALAWINEQEEHKKISGYYFACINLGFLSSLVLTGYFSGYSLMTGVLIFTVLATLALMLSLGTIRRNLAAAVKTDAADKPKLSEIAEIILGFLVLFFSVAVLSGTTGVVISIYPGFSGISALAAGILIGLMDIGTITGSLCASRRAGRDLRFEIPAGALIIAALVLILMFIPAGNTGSLIAAGVLFIGIGAAYGTVTIAQVDYLSKTKYGQGAVLGIYNLFGYAGMAFMPFAAGILAESSYPQAFLATALLCLTVCVTIILTAKGGKE
ncbi:MAG: MFS transporter [Methanomicrobium sp.]|nr:MFS transporter [Methanomicrobium sp.]MBQ3718467.1 MFS transporter [Methanomicrobium sp.]